MARSRLLAVPAALALLAAPTACSYLDELSCPASTDRAVLDTLYFGASHPGGSVTDRQWQIFMEGVITPAFPNGLTVFDAAGQWRGKSGIVEDERTRVLQLVHPDDQASEHAVRHVIDRYKSLYRQEAVLRVRELGCVSF